MNFHNNIVNQIETPSIIPYYGHLAMIQMHNQELESVRANSAYGIIDHRILVSPLQQVNCQGNSSLYIYLPLPYLVFELHQKLLRL